MAGREVMGTGQLMFIEGRWVDKASPAFKQTMQKMKGAAQTSSRQMKGMVDQNMGRAMSQFNEKTEKGRQLLTAFGGAVGGAAGNVVYYTGTLSYVIGRFGVWELAIMGVVAAIGGLVWWVTKESEKEKIWAGRIKQAREELDKLHDSVTDFLESERQQVEGWTKYEIQMAKVNKGLDKHKLLLADVVKDYEEWKEKAPAREVLAGQVPDEMVERFTKLWFGLGQAQRDAFKIAQAEATGLMKLMDEAIAKEKEIEEKADKPKGGPKGEPEDRYRFAQVPDIARMMADEERDYDSWMSARENFYSRLTGAYQAAQDQLTQIHEENADRREQIWENESRMAEEKIQHQHEVVRNSIGIFSELGDVLTKGTKANTAARIAAIVLEAAWDAAVYTYKGFEALAKANPWEAAMHFTAAGMAAAVAAGRVAGAAGGGGASVGSRERGQGDWGYKEDVKKEQTLHIYIDIGKKRFGDAVVNAIEDELDRDSPGRKRPKVS